MNKKCSCCSEESTSETSPISGKYVCYCNKVTEDDIRKAIEVNGASSVDEVIKLTGAMVNSNCKVNNPKGACCYPEIVQAFNAFNTYNK